MANFSRTNANEFFNVAKYFFNTKGNDFLMNRVLMSRHMVSQGEDGIQISVITEFPLSLCKFPTCQKDRVNNANPTVLGRILENYNSALLGMITVVIDEDENVGYVADGHGRVTVTTMKYDRENILEQFRTIPAIVHVGVPSNKIDQYIRNMFESQFDCVRPLKDVEKHTSRIESGDFVVITMDRVCREHDLIPNPSQLEKAEGKQWLRDYTGAKTIVNKHGGDCLNYILDILCRAEYLSVPSGTSRYILRSLEKVWMAYGDEISSLDDIVEIISGVKPTTLRKLAYQNYADRSDEIAVALYIDEVLSEQYHYGERRMNTNGDAIRFAA